MTDLGFQIGWLALRVSVVALLAAALASWSARRAARSAVIVLAAAATVLVGLGVAAFCPLPQFGPWSPPAPAESAPEAIADLDRAFSTGPDPIAPTQGLDLSRAWRMLRNLPAEGPQAPAWQHGGAILAALYALGAALAGLRLVSGWLAVQVLRRRSRPITDVELVQSADSLRVALGCSRHVELRECDEPGLAATIGWWRPIVFLPPEWPVWSGAERQAVLAHELAHVRHGDFLAILVTRLAQSLYFYHPLLYWMSSQLRWQQELAADDLAASALPERGQYLKALASLALRSPARMSARALPWSAMTGGTLLRRINMLRGTRKSRPLGWTMHGLLIGLLAGAGLLLTTLGSPATSPEQEKASGGSVAEKTEPFELGYLPGDSKAYTAIRPAVLLKQPGMEKLGALLTLAMQDTGILWGLWPDAVQAEHIEQVVANSHFSSAGTGKPGSRGFEMSSMFVRLDRDFDWPTYFKNASKQPSRAFGVLANAMQPKNGELKVDVTEVHEDEVTIYCVRILGFRHAVSGAEVTLPPIYAHVPDRRSLVISNMRPFATENKAFREAIRNVAKARQRDWGAGSKKVAHAPIAMVVDNHEQHYAKLFAKDVGADELKIIENIRFAALGIELGDGRPVRLILDAKSGASAPEMETAVEVLARTLLEKIGQAKADDKEDKTQMKLACELLQSRKLHREGAQIEVVGHSSVRIRDFFNFDPGELKKLSEGKPD